MVAVHTPQHTPHTHLVNHFLVLCFMRSVGLKKKVSHFVFVVSLEQKLITRQAVSSTHANSTRTHTLTKDERGAGSYFVMTHSKGGGSTLLC